jgi:hypothetical protein
MSGSPGKSMKKPEHGSESEETAETRLKDGIEFICLIQFFMNLWFFLSPLPKHCKRFARCKWRCLWEMKSDFELETAAAIQFTSRNFLFAIARRHKCCFSPLSPTANLQFRKKFNCLLQTSLKHSESIENDLMGTVYRF